MNIGDIRDFGVVAGAASPTRAPAEIATMPGPTSSASRSLRVNR
jgi:hypothetical protein